MTLNITFHEHVHYQIIKQKENLHNIMKSYSYTAINNKIKFLNITKTIEYWLCENVWKMSRTGTRKQKISPLNHGKYSSDDLRWFCLIFTEFTRRMQADNTRLANVESWTRGQVWGRSAYLEKHCKRARTADDGGVARPTGSRGVPAAIKWGQKAQDLTINTKTQKFTTEIKFNSK